MINTDPPPCPLCERSSSKHMSLNLAHAGRSQAALSYFGICAQRPSPSSSSSSSPPIARSSVHQQVLDKGKPTHSEESNQQRCFPPQSLNITPPSTQPRDALTDGALMNPTGRRSARESKCYSNEHHSTTRSHCAVHYSCFHPHSCRCHGILSPFPVWPRLYLILTRINCTVHNIHSCTRSQI